MKLSRRSWFMRLFAWGLALLAWSAAAPTAQALGGPQPAIGEPAPTFSLPTNSGDGEISLSDYQGHWVVLYFYPQDFTSGCTLEAKRFQQSLDDYQALNAQIIGVSADDVASHESFCDAEGLVFPLLSDETGQVSRAYGSWLTGRSLRHTYLIDPDGILRERFLGVRPAIHSQEVLMTLEDLQKTV
ncbi:MAG: peroxiredoxin [Leptolyngbya sp. SIO1E4]|nr:peroxiredoxin [Leptolyngbya sp. SIO1E4]